MLVSETINTMISQNITFSKFDKILQDQSKKKINVTLIGFNNCENNEIVEIMEKEFPDYYQNKSTNIALQCQNLINIYGKRLGALFSGSNW